MTSSPLSVGSTDSLAKAHELMRQFRIRHLPVLDGGHLVGIVSERDLHLVETLQDVDPEQVCIEEAMTCDVLTVQPEAQLDDVVRSMLHRRCGSAIVVCDKKVVGVFTTSDALQVGS